MAKKAKATPIKGKQSLQMKLEDTVSYESGKNDQVSIDIVVPARSVKSFIQFINNLGSLHQKMYKVLLQVV